MKYRAQDDKKAIIKKLENLEKRVCLLEDKVDGEIIEDEAEFREEPTFVLLSRGHKRKKKKKIRI